MSSETVPVAPTPLHRLVEQHARATPSAPAIGDVLGRALSYARLHAQTHAVEHALRSLGIVKHDRVAIVLPNGPEMAVAFVAVSAAATCAPLNPAYRASEFEFYLSDLGARALIVQRGIVSPATEVARQRGISVLELIRDEAEPGAFRIEGAPLGAAGASGQLTTADDVALVLHTSGTTARPKIVPLTHAQLAASAAQIARTLALGAADRCLNVMPLFHIHGLVGALLSSLSAGAAVHCAPGLQSPAVIGWLAAVGATWYTAVPTIHRAMLDAAAGQRELLSRVRLRFIRSSSASLPPTLMRELEALFSVPVLEAYGMTEASHQIASNPLPPRPRKPGSVGLAAGPELRIVDGAGNPVAAGEIGEVVIHGPSVMRGYQGNGVANDSAFFGQFFRTGDQGRLDDDGYVFLTGRIKELINRAGEKVSPREIDELLLQHPAVAQAVTFAVPHTTLGEDVAAAVVLEPGATVTSPDLQRFARERLAAFKVPQQIVIVSEIPKGPTGKLQRIGLAKLLEKKLRADFVAPRDALEEELARIWIDVLQVDQVGVKENFFSLGGDSLRASVIADRASRLGISADIVFQYPTIAEIVAAHQERQPVADASPSPPAVAIGAAAAPPAGTAMKRWLLALALAIAAMIVARLLW